MAIIVCFSQGISIWCTIFRLVLFTITLKYAGYVFPFEFRSLCIGCADTVKFH